MSTQSIIALAVSAIYLAACLVIGMWPSKRTSDSAEGYVAGDRSLGLLVMYFITGATIFSAFAFLGAPGWAYTRGVAALYILGYGALGFLPFYFLGPRAARLGREYGFVTQAEMVAARFGHRGIAGLMALISVAAFVPYLALQMKGAGYVLNAMTGDVLSQEVGAAIVYGVVLLYVMKSGVLGVGWTNTFQGLFMMVLAWGLGLYLPWKLYGGIGPMFDRIAEQRPELLTPFGLTGSGDPWPGSEYAGAMLASIIGFSFWPHLFMKAFTARDNKTIRRTVALYPTFQIFLVPILIIGFCGVLFATHPEASDQILPHILMNTPELPALVVGLFCAGALAASMSSGDAMVHSTASIIVRDGLIRSCGMQLDSRRERRLIRWLLAPVLVLSYVLAVAYEEDLVKLLLYAYGPVSQFAPAVIATLCWRKATGWGVFSGMLAGVLVLFVLLARPELRPIPTHAGLYGLAANTLTLIVVSLLTRAKSREPHSERFLEVARSPDSA